jgi:hypothetical protein
MSTRIWKKFTILLLLAVELLTACLQSNDSMSRDRKAKVTVIPQTPGINMENTSSSCRIRDEIPLGEVATLNLPEVDARTLTEQDQNLPKDAPFRFATSIEVNIKPADDDAWEKIDNNLQIWRLRILSPKALSISLGFTTFNMPPEGCLFVYSPDHDQILGPYTNYDNEGHGQLWTPTIEGEEVIIEISIPEDLISQLQLELGYVNQGYK